MSAAAVSGPPGRQGVTGRRGSSRYGSTTGPHIEPINISTPTRDPEVHRVQPVPRRPPHSGPWSGRPRPEIEACALVGQGRWNDASAKAQQVAQALSSGGATAKGYRGFWLYLSGIWAYRAVSASTAAISGGLTNAHALIRQAEQTTEGTWARYMPPLPAVEAPVLTAQDDQAVATATNLLLLQMVAPGRLTARLADMIEGLKKTASSAYEPALTELGIFLGAEASKPAATGRCDSTWCWGNHLWAVIEAKSDQKPEGVIRTRTSGRSETNFAF